MESAQVTKIQYENPTTFKFWWWTDSQDLFGRLVITIAILGGFAAAFLFTNLFNAVAYPELSSVKFSPYEFLIFAPTFAVLIWMLTKTRLSKWQSERIDYEVATAAIIQKKIDETGLFDSHRSWYVSLPLVRELVTYNVEGVNGELYTIHNNKVKDNTYQLTIIPETA